MTNFEQGKRAAIEATAEIFERIEKANGFLEKAREEKDLVAFAYWFVLIHEYYYMLLKPLLPRELERIYAELDYFTPIDYLKHKREQGYERLPDHNTTYGSGYNLPDIIGCALSNRYFEEIFTFYPDIKGMSCDGTLVRQNLMLHFLQTAENRQQVDYCDSCGRNLNDQPYPYAYICTKCGRIFNLCAKCSKEQIHKSWGYVGRKENNDYEDFVYRRMFQKDQEPLCQDEIDKTFADKGILEFTEGGKIDAREIVSMVKRVLERINLECGTFYRKTLRDCTILYIYNDKEIKTLCVDECNNIYVSANYLYNVLKMDESLIYALFMSGAYRILHTSFTQEQRFLDKGMPKSMFETLRETNRPPVELTKPLHHDINIALDLQTNSILIRSKILPYDTLKTRMNAICVNNTESKLIGNYYYHEIMGKIRDKINLTFPSEPTHKPAPRTFLDSYRHTWIRISKLVFNYGEAKTYKKIKLIIKHIRKDNLQSLQNMFA